MPSRRVPERFTRSRSRNSQDTLHGATFSDAKVRGCPYMSTVGQQTMSSLSLSLCLCREPSPPPRAARLRSRTRVEAYTRAHTKWGPHGVITMECLGRSGSKKGGRVSSGARLCARVLFLGCIPSRASSFFHRQLLSASENSSWRTFLRLDLRDRSRLPLSAPSRYMKQRRRPVMRNKEKR